MSTRIDLEITSSFQKDIFGNPEVLAFVIYRFYRGDTTGELEHYQIYDPFFDELVSVDLESLTKFQLKQIQDKIDKHILENPEIFEREPEEAS